MRRVGCAGARDADRARAHPAERGECRGRSMTRRARQGDRSRAERMRAASRASAAGLPRASPRRHLTRRRATGADFHPSAARRRGVRGSRRHGRGRRGAADGARMDSPGARRGDIRVPGARRRRAAARARAPAHSAAIVRIRPPVAYSCATRRLLRAPRSPARAIGRSRRARRRSAPRAARRRARLAARTRCSMSAAPR